MENGKWKMENGEWRIKVLQGKKARERKDCFALLAMTMNCLCEEF